MDVEHGTKVVERVFEKRLRKMVEIREEQYRFIAGKGTTDAILILRQLQKKYLGKDKELYWCLWTWRRHLTGCQEC